VVVELDGSIIPGNHYDDDNDNDHHKQHSPLTDLPVQPGEESALFYGLQVLESSSDLYPVVIRGTREKKETNEEKPASKESKGNNKKRKRSAADSDKTDVLQSKSDAKPIKNVLSEQAEKPQQLKSSKKRSKSDSNVQEADEDKKAPASDAMKDDTVDIPSKKSKKKKAKKQQAQPSESCKPPPTLSSTDLLTIQSNWSIRTGVWLSDTIAYKMSPTWSIPTPIQVATLGASLSSSNIVGAAPTGSGKTLAYVLPVMQYYYLQQQDQQQDQQDQSALQALMIVPTRELARQVQAVVKIFESNVACLVGGLSHAQQARLLRKRPPIVVGTVGRLWEMVRMLFVSTQEPRKKRHRHKDIRLNSQVMLVISTFFYFARQSEACVCFWIHSLSFISNTFFVADVLQGLSTLARIESPQVCHFGRSRSINSTRKYSRVAPYPSSHSRGQSYA